MYRARTRKRVAKETAQSDSQTLKTPMASCARQRDENCASAGPNGGEEEEGWGAQPVGPERSRAELSGGHRREEHA